MAASRELVENLGGLLSRGAIAGLVAGWGFILINMGWASSHGKPAVAPFLSISTIFYGTSAPLHNPMSVAVGVVMHLALSLLFGMVFALAVPFLRRVWILALGAAVYGILLWVINFEIFGNTLFPWFTNPKGPPVYNEIWMHVIFGLVLVPFFIGAIRSVRDMDPRVSRAL